MLMKLCMPCNIQLVYTWVKTPKSMMCRTITQENTKRRSKNPFYNCFMTKDTKNKDNQKPLKGYNPEDSEIYVQREKWKKTL